MQNFPISLSVADVAIDTGRGLHKFRHDYRVILTSGEESGFPTTLPTLFARLRETLAEPQLELIRPLLCRINSCPHKVFSCSIEDHTRAISALETLGLQVEPVPREILSLLMEPAQTGAPREASPPHTVPGFQKLYPWQKEGVDFILERGARAILADGMGLGKTYQAIATMQVLGCSSLIVCPASLKQNWKQELGRFQLGDTVTDISRAKFDLGSVGLVTIPNATPNSTPNSTSNSTPNATPNATQILIVSYELVRSMDVAVLKKHLRRLKVKFGILDEAHYIKNPNAKQTKKVMSLARQLKHLLLLTGTPAVKSAEMYTQLKILDPHSFSRFKPYGTHVPVGQHFFASRYTDMKKEYLGRNKYVFSTNGNRRSWELSALIRRRMIKRGKEVLKQLPPKTRVTARLSQQDEAVRKSIEEGLRLATKIREERGIRPADAQLMEVVRKTAKHKVAPVLAHLKLTLQSPEKTLLFVHHHQMFDAVESFLRQQKVCYVGLDGRTPKKKKKTVVRQFQEDERVRVALLGIKAAGTGLNLFKATRVIFLELIWSCNDHLQAEDRAHRIGQTLPVTVQYVILESSTDEIMWRSICKKVADTCLILEQKKRRLQYSECGPIKIKKRKHRL